jgi:hypothetical protein
MDSRSVVEARHAFDISSVGVGLRNPVKLGTIKLGLSDELAAALARQEGVLFERTIGGEYEGHLRGR